MKLSIVMPCFNVEATIIRALDSILMQKTNFEYEIIIVDDASTDNTLSIVNRYAYNYSNIVVLCNEKNRGNAYTYHKGLSMAKGEYFCVLDGDDYYTLDNKLQRQVDFLDQDVNHEYVGTSTNYIIDCGNELVSIPDRSNIKEFTYCDFLTQNSGYYHTSTYMYRNIFKGNVPNSFAEELYRGDTPRTMFHLKYSAKKIKVLDFVGSAYTFEHSGLWSSLSQKQQYQYQINYQIKHKKRVDTVFEKASCDRIVDFNKKKFESASDDLRRYPAITIDEALIRIKRYADTFAFKQKDYVLNNFYFSDYIDSLCASLGYVFNVHHPIYCKQEVDNNNVCIVIGSIRPRGGGIFAEIDELIGMFESKNVYLVVSGEYNSEESIKLLNEGLDILKCHNNLRIILPPKEIKLKYMWLREKIAEIKPCRTYYYCSHSDTYGAALPQRCSNNIVLFSFDHGFVCGILNPLHNTIIAKRKVDYWFLKKLLNDKVVLVPTWEKEAIACDGYKYIPFANHENLVTASGAARFYKVDGVEPYRYIDYILELLAQTHGIHYHFGPMPDTILEEVKKRLEELGLPKDSFINITWSDNIPLELLKNKVDIFIEPFPVVSYKLTLLVESVGIPIIAKKGLRRMDIIDFVPNNNLFWSTKDEFMEILTNLDTNTLQKLSVITKDYFSLNHKSNLIKELLLSNKGIGIPESIMFTDDCPMDIMNFRNLFGNNYNIKITTDVLNDLKRGKTLLNNKAMPKLEYISIDSSDGLIYNEILNIRSNIFFSLFYFITYPFKYIKNIANNNCESKNLKTIISMRKTRPDVELIALKSSISFKLAKIFDRNL